MKCEHCGFEFDTVALKARQGTATICPSCGKATTVRYSFWDSAKDFHGFLVRDPKYVSRPWRLVLYALAVVALLLLAAYLAHG